MSAAVLRAMTLGLLRDRGALAMTFILPAVVFLIFAAIFAGASGQQLKLQISVADELQTPTTRRLVAALASDSALDLQVGTLTAEAVREQVRTGAADAGLIIRADARALDDLDGFGPAPLELVTDPVRAVAGPMLAGQVQRAYFEALPDVALSGVVGLLENQMIELSELQQEQLDQGFAEIRDETERSIAAGEPSGWGFGELLESTSVTGPQQATNHVAYYAGAVAVLFVLFAAVNGALTLLEERDNGLIDRIVAGPGSVRVLVDGKFLFLAIQGALQIGVIYIVAWLVHGVDLPGHLLPWSITTLIVAAAAAGLALVTATICRTKRQAQTVANVAILILSALGGSMVPRFLMPESFQAIGWITPNAWALEAYTTIFWRDGALIELLLPWAVLSAIALLGWWGARTMSVRMERG